MKRKTKNVERSSEFQISFLFPSTLKEPARVWNFYRLNLSSCPINYSENEPSMLTLIRPFEQKAHQVKVKRKLQEKVSHPFQFLIEIFSQAIHLVSIIKTIIYFSINPTGFGLKSAYGSSVSASKKRNSKSHRRLFFPPSHMCVAPTLFLIFCYSTSHIAWFCLSTSVRRNNQKGKES
jgi:hypothetical protein